MSERVLLARAMKESLKTAAEDNAARKSSPVSAPTTVVGSKKRKRAEDLAVPVEVERKPKRSQVESKTVAVAVPEALRPKPRRGVARRVPPPKTVAMPEALQPKPRRGVAVRVPPRSRQATPTPTASQTDGNHLVTVELEKTVPYGPKGKRVPRQLTARLSVYKDPLTTCRQRYDAEFYLCARGDHCADSQVAEVSGFLIKTQESNWKEELLHLDESEYTDDNDENRYECVKLLTTLFEPNGRVLREKVDKDFGILTQDIMHIGAVHVFEAQQKRGLLSPVLKAYRELLCGDDLGQAGLKHEGLILLAPGRFNDSKSDCWGKLTSPQVTTELVKIYPNADNYSMVIKDGKGSGHTVTIMGRMASDTRQTNFDDKREAERIQARAEKAELKSLKPTNGIAYKMFEGENKPARSTRSGKRFTAPEPAKATKRTRIGWQQPCRLLENA